jgi:hypothetical protein
MFDNDFDNTTNYNDSKSQMIEVTLNQQNMTAQVNWSWTAPRQYYSTYLGAAAILPNGNWMGDFGPPTHQFPQNKPWDFDNTGGVLIEVNPQGQIMRTITFQTGWFIYRFGLVSNLSQNEFIPTPTESPTPLPIGPPFLPPALPLMQAPTPSPTIVPNPAPTPIPTHAETSSPSPKPPPSSNLSLMFNVVYLLIAVMVIVLALLAYLRKRSNH